MKLRHLLLATLEDADSPLSWSGTAYKIANALRRHVEYLTVMSSMPVKKTISHGIIRATLGPIRYPLWRTAPALNAFGTMVDDKVRSVRPDAVISISTPPIVRSAMIVPTFFMSDTPWKSWRETYSKFEAEPWYATHYSKLEASVAERCEGMFFGSAFGLREAERLYGQSGSKAIVAPLGANLQPQHNYDMKVVLDRKASNPILEILFVGKDWERKGGPLVLAVAKDIHQRGVAVKLHVVGCNPPEANQIDYVECHGALNISDSNQRFKLEHLMENSHFLLVPTEAECFGVIFAEAQMFGLIPITRLIHATGDIIIDGVTGFTLDDNSSIEDYAKLIIRLFQNNPAYRKLAVAARARATNQFDWDLTASLIVDHISRRL